MQDAINKAATLIEAMGYIQRFSDKIVIIKMGGSVMDEPEALENLVKDVVFLRTVGMRPVVVHGGGKAISQAMEDRGLEVQFIRGRRYTDQRTLTVVEHVLCNEINRRIVDLIAKHGGQAMGLHTLASSVLFGDKLFLVEDDKKIDLGFVGKVTSVNARLIELLCSSGTIPVIAPLARDRTGMRLNCNADTAAGEVASAVKAEKLVMVTDTHGIRRDPADAGSLADAMDEKEIRKAIADGVISGGMLPKVECCLGALGAGVARTHIIDGRFTHSLLLEIFSDSGAGTLIHK